MGLAILFRIPEKVHIWVPPPILEFASWHADSSCSRAWKCRWLRARQAGVAKARQRRKHGISVKPFAEVIDTVWHSEIAVFIIIHRLPIHQPCQASCFGSGSLADPGEVCRFCFLADMAWGRERLPGSWSEPHPGVLGWEKKCGECSVALCVTTSVYSQWVTWRSQDVIFTWNFEEFFAEFLPWHQRVDLFILVMPVICHSAISYQLQLLSYREKLSHLNT